MSATIIAFPASCPTPTSQPPRARPTPPRDSFEHPLVGTRVRVSATRKLGRVIQVHPTPGGAPLFVLIDFPGELSRRWLRAKLIERADRPNRQGLRQ